MDFELMVTTIVAGMVSNGNFTLAEDMKIVVDAAIEAATLIKEKTAKS